MRCLLDSPRSRNFRTPGGQSPAQSVGHRRRRGRHRLLRGGTSRTLPLPSPSPQRGLHPFRLIACPTPSASHTSTHPRGDGNTPPPGAKKTRNHRPQPPSFLPIPSSFFVAPRARMRARTSRTHQPLFVFPLHFFTHPSQPSVALRIRGEDFVPGNFTFASPDFCTKSPCRNNLHRTFSHGELCMNVNASPFCRRSAVRFNGLAREGEG